MNDYPKGIDINEVEAMQHRDYGRAKGWKCQEEGCASIPFWFTGVYHNTFIHPHKCFDYKGRDHNMTFTEEFVPCCSIYHAKLYFTKRLVVMKLSGEALPIPDPDKIYVTGSGHDPGSGKSLDGNFVILDEVDEWCEDGDQK